MLDFFSASARIVNSKRAITECLEVAMGDQYSTCDLLLIHASIGHDFSELIEQAKILAPNARVLGASCCGVVGKEGVSESLKDIAVMAVRGNEFAVESCDGIFGYNSYLKCKEMAVRLKASSTQQITMLYFMASGIDIDNNECIRAFDEVFGAGITIFGATSSDNMRGFISYQTVDNNVFEHGAFVIGFSDPSLGIETQATHGFVAVGDPLIVTKSEGNKILELNGNPAWEEYINRLGLSSDATCVDSIPIGALAEELSPALAIEYGNKHILRAVTKHEGSAMFYATTIQEGTSLWLTVRDEDLIFSEMDNMVECLVEKLSGRTPIAVFHADCLARGRFLFNRIIKEELVGKMQFPFYTNGECPPWIGMYGFGEFARLGNENTFHNYTTALYVLCR
ncbi:MAG: FIST N-terminal domain-containing protein [Bacteroidia bacterium]